MPCKDTPAKDELSVARDVQGDALNTEEAIPASIERSTSRKPQFFGRRKGKRIRPAREKLFSALLPKLLIDLPEYNSEGMDKLNLDSLFPFTPKEYRLEIGFGGGEHLAQQSFNNQECAFIGAEVFVNGVAGLVAHIAGAHDDSTRVEQGAISPDRADNVRIFNDDVRLLLNALPDESFSFIYVLFPDPWPKKRHASRRFIGPSNIPTLARLLKKGGILRVASDDMNYIRWSLQHLNNYERFEWTAKCSDDWNKPPSDWCPTRYEQKAIQAGRNPIYLDFKRI